jgi:hypothetical protein
MNKRIAITVLAARAGTALPTARRESVRSLGCFENKSRGQLGCRP